MTKSYQDELLSLLCSSEHIAATLDIARVIGRVKPTLQIDFWRAVNRRISESLGKKGLDGKWRLERYQDPFIEPAKNDTGFRCVLQSPSSGTPRIHVAIAVWQLKLFVGVGFTSKRPQNEPEEVHALSQSLEQEKFRLPKESAEHAAWIAYKEFDVNLDQEEFLRDMSSDPTLAVETPVEFLTELLRKHGQAIEASDNSLG